MTDEEKVAVVKEAWSKLSNESKQDLIDEFNHDAGLVVWTTRKHLEGLDWRLLLALAGMGAAYTVTQGTFLRMRKIIKMLWQQSAGTRINDSSRNKYIFVAPRTPVLEQYCKAPNTPEREQMEDFMKMALEKDFKAICIEYNNDKGETVLLKLTLLVYHFSDYAAVLEKAGYCLCKIPKFTDQDSV